MDALLLLDMFSLAKFFFLFVVDTLNTHYCCVMETSNSEP